MLNTTQPQGKAPLALVALEHHLPWIADNIQALWRYYRRWKIGSERHAVYDNIMLAYIQLLESLFNRSATPGPWSPVSLKIAQTLTSSFTELLDTTYAPSLSESVQIRMALALTRLRHGFTSQSIDNSTPERRPYKNRHIIQSGLEDSVARLLQDVEYATKLHKDLQVRDR